MSRVADCTSISFEEILAGLGELMVTRKGSDGGFDFVARVFAPNFGVLEGPVCRTLHCSFASLWASKLGKETLLAYQALKQGGMLS